MDNEKDDEVSLKRKNKLEAKPLIVLPINLNEKKTKSKPKDTSAKLFVEEKAAAAKNIATEDSNLSETKAKPKAKSPKVNVGIADSAANAVAKPRKPVSMKNKNNLAEIIQQKTETQKELDAFEKEESILLAKNADIIREFIENPELIQNIKIAEDADMSLLDITERPISVGAETVSEDTEDNLPKMFEDSLDEVVDFSAISANNENIMINNTAESSEDCSMLYNEKRIASFQELLSQYISEDERAGLVDGITAEKDLSEIGESIYCDSVTEIVGSEDAENSEMTFINKDEVRVAEIKEEEILEEFNTEEFISQDKNAEELKTDELIMVDSKTDEFSIDEFNAKEFMPQEMVAEIKEEEILEEFNAEEFISQDKNAEELKTDEIITVDSKTDEFSIDEFNAKESIPQEMVAEIKEEEILEEFNTEEFISQDKNAEELKTDEIITVDSKTDEFNAEEFMPQETVAEELVSEESKSDVNAKNIFIVENSNEETETNAIEDIVSSEPTLNEKEIRDIPLSVCNDVPPVVIPADLFDGQDDFAEDFFAVPEIKAEKITSDERYFYQTGSNEEKFEKTNDLAEKQNIKKEDYFSDFFEPFQNEKSLTAAKIIPTKIIPTNEKSGFTKQNEKAPTYVAANKKDTEKETQIYANSINQIKDNSKSKKIDFDNNNTIPLSAKVKEPETLVKKANSAKADEIMNKKSYLMDDDELVNLFQDEEPVVELMSEQPKRVIEKVTNAQNTQQHFIPKQTVEPNISQVPTAPMASVAPLFEFCENSEQNPQKEKKSKLNVYFAEAEEKEKKKKVKDYVVSPKKLQGEKKKFKKETKVLGYKLSNEEKLYKSYKIGKSGERVDVTNKRLICVDVYGSSSMDINKITGVSGVCDKSFNFFNFFFGLILLGICGCLCFGTIMHVSLLPLTMAEAMLKIVRVLIQIGCFIVALIALIIGLKLVFRAKKNVFLLRIYTDAVTQWISFENRKSKKTRTSDFGIVIKGISKAKIAVAELPTAILDVQEYIKEQ